MRLKRLYDQRGATPTVSGIKILRAGPTQHFSPGFVEGGVAEGWLTMSQGQIVLHGVDGDVAYRVVRTPGRYGDEVINYYDCSKVEEG